MLIRITSMVLRSDPDGKKFFTRLPHRTIAVEGHIFTRFPGTIDHYYGSSVDR